MDSRFRGGVRSENQQPDLGVFVHDNGKITVIANPKYSDTIPDPINPDVALQLLAFDVQPGTYTPDSFLVQAKPFDSNDHRDIRKWSLTRNEAVPILDRLLERIVSQNKPPTLPTVPQFKK